MNPVVVDQLDRALIKATQAGLPLVDRPYAAIAAEFGIMEPQVRQRLARMIELGIIRRIGVVPNHYALGMTDNCMSVWDVEDAQLSTLGPQVGALEFVSHCYHRPRRLPIWPFNLFAMVHGRTRAEVDEKVKVIAALLGASCQQRDLLMSRRILKKTGLRLAA